MENWAKVGKSFSMVFLYLSFKCCKVLESIEIYGNIGTIWFKKFSDLNLQNLEIKVFWTSF